MKKSIFKRAVSSAAAIALALANVVTQVNAEVKDVDLSGLAGYTLDGNVFKVCEAWSAEVEIAEDVNVSFQLEEVYTDSDMIAIQLTYCDAGWAWHHDYIDADYSADEIYKVTVPAGKYHMFQIAPSAAKDADGDNSGSVCWQYNFKNVKTTTGEEDGDNKPDDEPETPLEVTIDKGVINITANQTWNWQGMMDFEADDFSAATLGDINVSTLTVKFIAAKATSGGKDFDLSKINYKIQIGAYDSDAENQWPWIEVGTSSYNSETQEVTITADVSDALKSVDSDIEFTGFKLIAMVDLADSEDEILLKIGSLGTDEPTVPDSIPATIKFYTQGNEAGGWAWKDNGDTAYTITSDSDAVEVKWEPVAVDDTKVTSADGFAKGGLQIAFSDPDLTLTGTKLNVEITDIMLGDTAIDDIVGEYTIVKNWDSSGTEIQIPLAFLTYDAVGKNLSAKVKVTTVTEKDPDDTEPKPDEPDEPDEPVEGENSAFVDPVVTNSPAATTPAEAETQPEATQPGSSDGSDNSDPNGSQSDAGQPNVTEPDVVVPGSAVEDPGTQTPGNVDGTGDGTEKPVATGFAIAFIPAAAAAVMAIVSKKRK